MRRLVAGQPTVYRTDDQHCYYFDESYRGRRMNAHELFHLNSRDTYDLWVLTDHDLTSSYWNKTWHRWFVVLASSERTEELSRQWVKDRNAGETYIDNWDWDEIYGAFT